jgi:hypothetical protein
MALFLNKLSGSFIDQQSDCFLSKFNIDQPFSIPNCNMLHEQITILSIKEKSSIGYDETILIQLTYYSGMRTLPNRFHLSDKIYFQNRIS